MDAKNVQNGIDTLVARRGQIFNNFQIKFWQIRPLAAQFCLATTKYCLIVTVDLF